MQKEEILEDNLYKIMPVEQQQPINESVDERVAPEIIAEQKQKTVSELTHEKEETAKALKKAREDLGVPQSDEEPPSIKSLNEQIQKNSTESAQIDEKENIKLERQKYAKFIDSAKSLLNAFNRRNGDRLSPLLDDAGLNRMKSAINMIDDLFSQKKFDADNLNEQIDKIGSAINSIGEARRGGKEDKDSLTFLITKIKGMGAECGDLIRILLRSNNGNQAESSAKALNRLSQTCDSSAKFVIRVREAFANYARR